MLHRYIVERNIPNIGGMSDSDLAAAAAKSNEALAQLSPHVQWTESFVAADQTFCVYLAENEEMVRRHSELSGFPADRIVEVPRVIDPTTAH